MTKGPDWAETLEDLDRRRQHAMSMGGPERLDKHHGKGKLDARARIERLLDPGTFRELGTLVGPAVYKMIVGYLDSHGAHRQPLAHPAVRRAGDQVRSSASSSSSSGS